MSDLVWTPVKIRLGQIKPWNLNPRMSTKAQAQRLIKSERRLGQIQTLAIGPQDEAGFYPLYDGHQRVSAFLTVKEPAFEVLALQSNRELTDDERREVSVTLHTATGSWDWDALASWSAADLHEWGMDKDLLKEWNNEASNLKEMLNAEQAESADAEPQIDRAAELLEKWQVKTGDLWQIGEHRLICGSCINNIDVERVLENNKARMIFTDPPWNVAIGKDSNPRHRQREGLQNDDMSDEDYASFVASFVDICEGDVYCKVASEYMDVIGGIFRSQKYHWSATVIWVKDIFVLGRSKYHRRYEPIWYGWHTNRKSSFGDARNLDDVWEIARPKRSEEHPTMMPIELPERAIHNSSVTGDIVYEPFCGSGSTLIACQNLGRRGRAVEISPAYCAVTLERMAQAFPGIEIKRLE